MSAAGRPIVLGRVSGLFGVQGWVKVYSYTRPPENILGFTQWSIGRPNAWRSFTMIEGQSRSKTLAARLADARGPLPDRDAAVGLLDCDIAVARDAMPALPPGEYYWCDLVGLEVVNRHGVALGEVTHVMATGANDVLVLSGERLVPFVRDEVILEVAIDGGRIVADWDPDF